MKAEKRTLLGLPPLPEDSIKVIRNMRAASPPASASDLIEQQQKRGRREHKVRHLRVHTQGVGSGHMIPGPAGYEKPAPIKLIRRRASTAGTLSPASAPVYSGYLTSGQLLRFSSF
jgi:hypothetical protein